MLRLLNSRWALLLFALPLAAARAGEPPANFTLGKYVPEECWMYVHAVDNKERAWINERWSQVFAELKGTGIGADLKSLIVSLAEPGDREKIDAVVTKVIGFVSSVNWGDLAANEFVIAERIHGAMPPGYEYVLLVRGKDGTGEANFTAMSTILKELAALSPEMALTNDKVESVDRWRLTFGKEVPAEMFQVALIRKGDIIGLIMGNDCCTAVPQLLSGKSERRAIVDSPRFKQAIAELPPPEDSITFFDARSFLKGFDSLMTTAFEKHGANDPDAQNARGVLRAVIALADFMDYVITTEDTDGLRARTHSILKLQDKASGSPICGAIFERAPFERFDQFIPADATGFTVSGFVDLEKLYKTAVDFVSKEIHDGPSYIAEWQALLAQIGFDPAGDLFSWWGGEMVGIDLPAAAVTPMGGSDGVAFIRVKNSELAAQKVNAGLDRFAAFMQQNGQPIALRNVELDGATFREVTHPMVAMFLRPVVGVKDGWLVIGSSPAAVSKCFAVAAGKAPSIAQNSRFKNEGLIPRGPVMSVSFSDTSKFGETLAGLMGGVSMGIGMASAGIPASNPEAAKVRDAMQRIATMAMKLAPAFQKIDFYSSEASMTTREGSTIRTTALVTYRKVERAESKSAELPAGAK